MALRVPPALRHRKFFLMWCGLLVSFAGSQMQLWALFWHIRTLTDQPIAVSGIGIVRFIPILAFSLFGGLVADLYDRRKVLLLTQSVMAIVALVFGLLTAMGTIQLTQIYLLTAIQAVTISFDLPARQSLMPNLVPTEDLPNAFSMQSLAVNFGAIIGPALSGVVIATLGQEYTYYINALSFIAVLLALIAIGPVPQDALRDRTVRVPVRAQTPGMNLSMIKDGVRFIFRQPLILSSMLLDFFAAFFSSANTLLPYVARDILHVGPIAYGWLSAAQSIGAVTAGVIASQRTQIRRQGKILLVSVFAFGLSTVVFGLSRSFMLTMAALILVGASDTVSTIIRNTIRQLQTPDSLRGRMVSVNQIFFMGGPQLGEVEAGVVAQALGIPFAIVSGGIGCVVAVAWVAWKWPHLGRYNGDEPILAGAPAD
jgi:MFS family permease